MPHHATLDSIPPLLHMPAALRKSSCSEIAPWAIGCRWAGGCRGRAGNRVTQKAAVLHQHCAPPRGNFAEPVSYFRSLGRFRPRGGSASLNQDRGQSPCDSSITPHRRRRSLLAGSPGSPTPAASWEAFGVLRLRAMLPAPSCPIRHRSCRASLPESDSWILRQAQHACGSLGRPLLQVFEEPRVNQLW